MQRLTAALVNGGVPTVSGRFAVR
jgi:hypothetical protein